MMMDHFNNGTFEPENLQYTLEILENKIIFIVLLYIILASDGQWFTCSIAGHT